MNQRFKLYYTSSFLILCFSLCKEPYLPPAVTANNNFLVVQGFINSGNDSSKITLSRTRNLSDSTFTIIPELYARISVEGESGTSYALIDQGNGSYVIGAINLDPSARYKLKILTTTNVVYESDFVPVQQAPAIDTVTWKQNRDVQIYLDTHDPQNNTKYYRWEFIETWEYHSFYDSNLGFSNGSIYFRDSSHLLTRCWQFENSDQIVVGTSAKLNQDVIERAPITTVPNGSNKISFRYSILVKQFALTQKAFEYWQLLQKSSQQSGSLFDAQPSQLIGNLHCIGNPQEPVIGYVSIGTVTEKRIFIRRSQLSNWNGVAEDIYCEPKFINPDSASYYLRDTSYSPAYYTTGGGLAIAKNSCVDCTLKGGTTEKPSYW